MFLLLQTFRILAWEQSVELLLAGFASAVNARGITEPINYRLDACGFGKLLDAVTETFWLSTTFDTLLRNWI